MQVASGSGVLPQQEGSTAQQLHDAEASTAAAHRSLAVQQQQQQQQAVELPGHAAQLDPSSEALTSYLVSLGAEVRACVAVIVVKHLMCSACALAPFCEAQLPKPRQAAHIVVAYAAGIPVTSLRARMSALWGITEE